MGVEKNGIGTNIKIKGFRRYLRKGEPMNPVTSPRVEPEPKEMVAWIQSTFNMSISSLAWMFQVHPRTIRAWLQGKSMTGKERMKLRKSYYFLTGKRDPYAGLIFCDSCHTWKESQEFENGATLCRTCKQEG